MRRAMRDSPPDQGYFLWESPIEDAHLVDTTAKGEDGFKIQEKIANRDKTGPSYQAWHARRLTELG